MRAVTVDGARFPEGTTFKFEISYLVATRDTFCARLYDRMSATVVAGTEQCDTNPDANNGLFLKRTVDVSVPTYGHSYEVQVKSTFVPPQTGCCAGYVFRARLLAY